MKPVKTVSSILLVLLASPFLTLLFFPYRKFGDPTFKVHVKMLYIVLGSMLLSEKYV